ncbi:Phospholipid-transporting ATPase [Dirofilaria immitis]|nr:Phospholipid-transporting ATPase [Dirofilaria immitis]
MKKYHQIKHGKLLKQRPFLDSTLFSKELFVSSFCSLRRTEQFERSESNGTESEMVCGSISESSPLRLDGEHRSNQRFGVESAWNPKQERPAAFTARRLSSGNSHLLECDGMNSWSYKNVASEELNSNRSQNVRF